MTPDRLRRWVSGYTYPLRTAADAPARRRQAPVVHTELPAIGRLAVVDPETGRRLAVDTSSRRVRERFAQLEHDRRQTIARELRRLRRSGAGPGG